MPISHPKSPPTRAFTTKHFRIFRRISWSELKLVLQILFCVCGIYACFGIWAHKQERVVTIPYATSIQNAPSGRWGKKNKEVVEYFPGVWSLTFLQSFTGFVLASCGLVVVRVSRRVLSLTKKRARIVSSPPLSAPSSLGRKQTGPSNTSRNAISRFLSKCGISSSSWRVCKPFSVLCFSNAFGTSIGYCAMRFVPYPVYLAAKMGKAFPVMFVGYFFLGIRYTRWRVILCTALTLSIYFFYFLSPPPANRGSTGSSKTKNTPGESKGIFSSHPGEVGMLLLFLNLIMDGITNATQDGFLRSQKKRWNGLQLMGAVNLGTSLWLLLAMGLAELPLRVNAGTSTDFSAPPCSSPFSVSQLWSAHDASRSLLFLQRHPQAAKDVAILILVNGVGQFFIFFTITLLGSLTLTVVTLVRKAGSVGVSIVLHSHPVRPMQGVALLTALICAFLDTAVSIRGAAHSENRNVKSLQSAGKRKETVGTTNVRSVESTKVFVDPATAPQGRQDQKGKKSSKSNGVSQEDNTVLRGAAAPVEGRGQAMKDDYKNGRLPPSPPPLLPSSLFNNGGASGVHLSQKAVISPPLQGGGERSSSSHSRRNETAGGAQSSTSVPILFSSSPGNAKVPLPPPQQHVERVPVHEEAMSHKKNGGTRRRR